VVSLVAALRAAVATDDTIPESAAAVPLVTARRASVYFSSISLCFITEPALALVLTNSRELEIELRKYQYSKSIWIC